MHPSMRLEARRIPDFSPCALQTKSVCVLVITDPLVVSGKLHHRTGLGARGRQTCLTAEDITRTVHPVSPHLTPLHLQIYKSACWGKKT